jgi:hypothetical protein
MVHEAQTREQARGDLIERWDRDRQSAPGRSRIILTHTNDEVRALNEAARERMRAASDLGDEVASRSSAASAASRAGIASCSCKTSAGSA